MHHSVMGPRTHVRNHGKRGGATLYEVWRTSKGKSHIVPVRKELTVTSLNIARPLTLHTSPSYYATFNQIKSFLLFNIGLLLEREKTTKSFHFRLPLLDRGGFRQNWKMMLKNFLTIISNDPNFKLFTLNQVIDEVNCWEQPGVTFPGIFCKSNSSKRSYWICCRKCAMLGDYVCYSKTGGSCTSNQSC